MSDNMVQGVGSKPKQLPQVERLQAIEIERGKNYLLVITTPPGGAVDVLDAQEKLGAALATEFVGYTIKVLIVEAPTTVQVIEGKA